MCSEIISFNAELSPPIYGLPATMQRIVREVSEKRQAAIDFALGPALGAASIAIGSRIVLNAYGYSNRLHLWIMMIGRSTANKTAPMKDIYAPLYNINNRLFDEYSAKVEAAKVEAMKAERAAGNDRPLPKTSQILIEDSTPEARNQAPEDNPHGLLDSREELTATIGDIDNNLILAISRHEKLNQQIKHPAKKLSILSFRDRHLQYTFALSTPLVHLKKIRSPLRISRFSRDRGAQNRSINYELY